MRTAVYSSSNMIVTSTSIDADVLFDLDQYDFKFVYKCHDRTTVVVEDVNEI